MLTTDYTAVAKDLVGPFIQRAGKSFLLLRCGDVFGQEQTIRVTPDNLAEFFAALAGLTGDWRPISELAKAALHWFERVNVTGMRRSARRLGLVPQF